MMLSARNSSPFTASQWQELEHQALIFKYMVSGVPIPPDLIYTVKKSLDSTMSARLFPHQPVGWGCFQVGFGSRKADPEPGRCRRTDGKKWRCSKEAFPDSKYCERHMHRGKNRSRKPVEVISTTPPNHPSPPPISSITMKDPSITTSSTTTTTSSSYSLYPLSETQPHHHPYHNTPHYPFLSYPHSSSSRPPDSALLSPQNNSTHHLFLDSASYSQAEKDYRYFHALREGIDERAFFPETSGTLRGPSESYSPLTMSSSGSYSHSQFQGLADNSKQQQQQEQHCFVLGTDFKSARPIKVERDDDETQKPLHHFFSEWPQKNRDTWLDLEDDPSTHASFSTTQLSISLPMSSHELHW
ncbi:hypothetical protein L1049_004462 [Liquidambar formosana]|uniref:Growth-regulating factor n=1 Tax=Liquidambar formosana TaxID=63359 RepID=A0AAP0WVP7_LIQFO